MVCKAASASKENLRSRATAPAAPYQNFIVEVPTLTGLYSLVFEKKANMSLSHNLLHTKRLI